MSDPNNPLTPLSPLDALASGSTTTPPPIEPAPASSAQADLNNALSGIAPAPTTPPQVEVASAFTSEPMPIPSSELPPVEIPPAPALNVTEHPIDISPPPMPMPSVESKLPPPPSSVPQEMTGLPLPQVDKDALEAKAESIINDKSVGNPPKPKGNGPSIKKLSAIGGALVALAIAVVGVLAGTGAMNIPGIAYIMPKAGSNCGGTADGDTACASLTSCVRCQNGYFVGVGRDQCGGKACAPPAPPPPPPPTDPNPPTTPTDPNPPPNVPAGNNCCGDTSYSNGRNGACYDEWQLKAGYDACVAHGCDRCRVDVPPPIGNTPCNQDGRCQAGENEVVCPLDCKTGGIDVNPPAPGTTPGTGQDPIVIGTCKDAGTMYVGPTPCQAYIASNKCFACKVQTNEPQKIWCGVPTAMAYCCSFDDYKSRSECEGVVPNSNVIQQGADVYCDASGCTTVPTGRSCNIVKYQCPDGSNPCNQNGQVCGDAGCSLDAGYCGSQQIDIRCTDTTNVADFVFSNNVCTTTPANPPPTIPTDDTPPPTLPPEQSLICVDLTSTNATPKINDTATFTCNATAANLTIASYKFRYKVDSGDWVDLTQTAVSSKQSSPLTVTQSGVYTIQCQACTSGNICTPWSAAQ